MSTNTRSFGNDRRHRGFARRLFFEQQLVQAKENLADAEEALKRTQQKTGLIQLDGQARAVIESVAQLRGQMAANRSRYEPCTNLPPKGIRIFG